MIIKKLVIHVLSLFGEQKMIGRVNQSAGNIFSNAASSMSRTRTDYSGSNEANMRALSKKDSQSRVEMAKDELEYDFADDFEQQMRDWRNDDYDK